MFIRGPHLLLWTIVMVSSALQTLSWKIDYSGVVGEEDAKVGEIPYHVAIQYNGGHICSGALVIVHGQQLVITAAHCLETGSTDRFIVAAANVNMLENSGLEQYRQVSSIHIHPNYDGWTFANDIAVLTTVTPFHINQYVSPISLPRRQQQTRGRVLASGYGLQDGYGHKLEKSEGTVVDDDTCQDAYGWETILPSMICTEFDFNVTGSWYQYCVEDSGGPLRAVEGEYLAGIFAFSYRCSAPEYPAVSTEISYFIDWLGNLVLH